MNQSLIQIADLSLPDNFDTWEPVLKASVIEYLNQLDPIERKAYKIAKEHLGSSFNVVKSNGFCDWLRELRSPTTPPFKGTNVPYDPSF
jgi:hypothetical protein